MLYLLSPTKLVSDSFVSSFIHSPIKEELVPPLRQIMLRNLPRKDLQQLRISVLEDGLEQGTETRTGVRSVSSIHSLAALGLDLPESVALASAASGPCVQPWSSARGDPCPGLAQRGLAGLGWRENDSLAGSQR